jgi:hypothetical protein
MNETSPDFALKSGPDVPMQSTRLKGVPAPGPSDLKKAMEQMPDGPNVAPSPWEVEAARGETALEGPRVEDAPVEDGKSVHLDTEG